MAKEKIVKKKSTPIKKPKAIVKKKKVSTKKYEPVTGRVGGRLTRHKWKEILTDGKELIESGKMEKMSKIGLARRWKINRETCDKAINVLGAEFGAEVPFIKARFLKTYEKLENNMLDILETSSTLRMCSNNWCSYTGEELYCPECDKLTARDIKGQKELAKEIPELMKNFTGFLEDFGFKDKASQKVEVEGNIKQTNIQINYNTQMNFIDNLDKKLKGIKSEKKKQELVIDLMEESKANEETNS